MTKQPKTAVDAKSQENLLVPKLWHGMTLSVWWRLLRSNQFDVSLSRLPTALMVTLFSLNNSVLGFVQRLIYDRQIKNTKIESGPIFVVGHYRSGTTMLQELLCRDPRFTFPTTYECFSPHHFLITERLFAWWLKLILPAQRLADRMLQGPDRPQEDEAALCCFGLPSRFHRFAFPNRQHGDQVNPNLDLLSARQRQDWKETFEYFLKAVTLRRPLPIVLKSPQHTCRIRHLAEMFPDARFVYIVRDPYVVFPSTVRLWKVIHESQALHEPNHRGLDELVLREFAEMHQLVERDRVGLDPSRFCEVHYEDLVADPIHELQEIYRQLQLGDFAPARLSVEQYLTQRSDYQTNRYEISTLQRKQIAGRWRSFIDQHGYDEVNEPLSAVGPE